MQPIPELVADSEFSVLASFEMAAAVLRLWGKFIFCLAFHANPAANPAWTFLYRQYLQANNSWPWQIQSIYPQFTDNPVAA